MALRVAREALKEEDKVMDLMKRVLRLETLDGFRTHLLTAPEITSGMLSLIAGAGNYDTMTEESSLAGKMTYLFQAKCRPYSILHHVPVGSLLIYNKLKSRKTS